MAKPYAKAGVSIEAGYEAVQRIKKQVKRTERKGTMAQIGGFGGCFDLSILDVEEPVLVSGTDGVGTKLLVANQENRHETIGIDCVAMCVNDIVAQGAQPLYFLDYIATGKTQPEQVEQIVQGVAEGCIQSGAALIGGETAEMPGLYQGNEYDIAGFAVGVAEKKQLITGEKVQVGDLLLGLPSSGVHSNGYSLVRKIFFTDHSYTGATLFEELSGKTLGEELLIPTKIYVNSILPLIRQQLLHGIAHITGGGFVENIPRMFGDTLSAEIELGSWPTLPIFSLLEKHGSIAPLDMYEIFNMGIGMVLAIAPNKLEEVTASLEKQEQEVFVIGKIIEKETTALVFKEV